MSNSILTTVVGWAATAPREIHGGRVPYTSFRLASTPRHYDREQSAWVEGRTEWLTVKAFRDTALNVAVSVNKGQPLVVHGRLKTEEWLGENGPRSGLVLEASALGHDLTRGRSTFVRTSHAETETPAPETDAPDPGNPDEAAEGSDEARTATVDPWAADPEANPLAELDQEVAAAR